MEKDITYEQYKYGDLSEMVLHFIETFMNENPLLYSEANFNQLIFQAIYNITAITLKDIYLLEYDDIEENIYENIQYYFNTLGLKRSYRHSIIIVAPKTELVESKLADLVALPQPEQKSEAWYVYRQNLLTASSIWKALDSDAAQNSLIYKKCCPLDLNKCFNVNINSAMHWGQKYEPISVMFYQNLYQTVIGEFGCIKHLEHSFLGASPDGINIKKDNPRYGRMLEIKNIVNREITGIPKKEYWVQMQLQMEVCDLDECDFLETRFKEYDNEEAFLEDGGYGCDKIRGVIVCFHSNEGPIYEYAPFHAACDETSCNEWINTCMEENQTMTWVKNTYWVLDEYSCILVPRNRTWFKNALPSFKKIWDSILYERIHGYDHRKPKKKEKLKNIILKVRTESFDESRLQTSET